MKKILIYGMGAFLMAGLWSCKDDVVLNDGPGLEDIGGETGYVTFSIKSANTGGMTRAGDAWNDGNGDYNQGDVAQGSFADENKIVDNIQANRVFFFDKDGKYHSSALLNLTKADGATNDSHDDGYGQTETVYQATVKRTSDRGEQNWPTQCLVILNGRPTRLNALLTQAQTNPDFNMEKFLSWVNKDFTDTDAAGEGETLGLYKYSDGKYYFTMTNSIYVDDVNVTEGGDGQVSSTKKIMTAAQITEKNLATTSEKAAENPVTVFVERIMSKVEVGFTGYDEAPAAAADAATKASYITEATPYGFIYSFTDKHEEDSKWMLDEEKTVTMKALITNWTINAVEYQTMLFKQVDNSWIANPIFTGWNDPNHHRSYWGKDFNYDWDADRYPTQYRSVYDGSESAKPYQDKTTGGWSFGKNTEETGGNDIFSDNYHWALDYKPYNKILSKRAYKYCLENTFGYEEGTTGNYKNMIMGSHVLIQGRLLTEDESKKLTVGEDGKATVTDLDAVIGDKYYYGDRYYDETNYINRQVAMLKELVGGELATLSVDNVQMWPKDSDGSEEKFTISTKEGNLYVKEEKEGVSTFKKVTLNATAEDGEISFKDVFTIAPAYIAKGDGKVTIALGTKASDGKITYGYGAEKVNLYYYTQAQLGEDNRPKADAGDPTQMTRNQLVSIIYGITNIGDCFKNGRMYYAVPIQHFLAAGAGEKYEFKYENLKVGDYGVVRNHWYKFVVNQILKPGIPVHDEDQPIIPNYDDEDRYIGLEVIILPWHIVDNGNVTLGQ